MYNSFFPFLCFSLVWFMEPRRSAPKEGDNVTATRACGRVTAILYSRIATRLRSLAIIVPINLFTITRVHVCNRIPLITIHMRIRLNTGVRAPTLWLLVQEQLGSLMTGTGVPWKWLWYIWEYAGALEKTLGAPGSVAEPTWEAPKISERCLGSYG